MVALAAWKEARELRDWKMSMDRASVPMAIVATFGLQISIQFGRQLEKNWNVQLREVVDVLGSHDPSSTAASA